VTWRRRPVAAALTQMIQASTAGTVYVHHRMPEIVNPMCVVVGRVAAGAQYATAAFGIDTVDLHLIVIGGAEQDDDIDDLRDTVRTVILGDSTLKGTVSTAWPTGENGWRNFTGAGGIQLLYVELVVAIQM
jgi:hypothetical protein